MATKTGNKLVTDLVGQPIQFDEGLHPLISGQRAVIRTVRVENGEPVYTVYIVNKSVLFDWHGNHSFVLVR